MPADLCWGLAAEAQQVVIMGTQYYDGSAGGGGVDYPVTDLLQMMGRAIRAKDTPQGSGRCAFVLRVPSVVCQQSFAEWLSRTSVHHRPCKCGEQAASQWQTQTQGVMAECAGGYRSCIRHISAHDPESPSKPAMEHACAGACCCATRRRRRTTRSFCLSRSPWSRTWMLSCTITWRPR